MVFCFFFCGVAIWRLWGMAATRPLCKMTIDRNLDKRTITTVKDADDANDANNFNDNDDDDDN